MNESLQRRRYLETRQAIVGAAYNILRASGVDGLSMRAIARAVHMSPANLYEYFANKDEIVQAIFAKTAAGLEAHLRQIDPSLPPQTYLTLLCMGYLEFASKEQEQMAILCCIGKIASGVQPTPSRSGTTHRALTSNTDGLFELFLTGVERYIELAKVTLPADLDRADIAQTLISLVYGFVIVTAQEGRTIAPATMRLVIQVFLQGLAATPSRLGPTNLQVALHR